MVPAKELYEESLNNGADLRLRLKELTAEKEKLQKAINQLNEELKKMFAKVPKKPRESMTELDAKISALEFKRTTNSLILADEKKILREIAGLQRTKKELDEFNTHVKLIHDKKAKLSVLRDTLKLTVSTLDAHESALAKVNLATKLGCTVEQMTTITVDCPSDKVGRVIGKSGATLKQIESHSRVTMDVDSVTNKITITGSEAALQVAVIEIDKVVQSIEEDVEVPQALLAFMTSKNVSAMAQLRQDHPDVYFDVPRNGSAIQLRGLPENVAAAKIDLTRLEITTEKRTITSQESGVLIGKKGSTVNQFIADHGVTIDVSRIGDSDEWIASVSGPADKVDEALLSIDALLDSNKDVVRHVAVNAIVRNALLSDGGAPIKNLQKTINDQVRAQGGWVMISFEKQSSQAESNLTVKGRKANVDVALEMIEKAVREIDASVVTIEVDQYIVPFIIGKGGSTIKELKKLGSGISIEVDKSGQVQIQGPDKNEVQTVLQAIQTVIDENQLEKIDFEPDAIKTMFRELIRAKSKQINSIVSALTLDEANSQIVLRGTVENIKKASAIVHDFLLTNYIEEVPLSAEDEPALMAGGQDSPLTKLAAEFEVEMFVVRARYVVLVRGMQDKVKAAAKRVKQFLQGGDGHTVSKITVTEQALGVVIGKGGCKRTELEAAHEGVSIFIHRSSIITIRGPKDKVEECRTEILRLVASVRTQQVMPLTEEQHAILNKPNLLKNATRGIPVQMTLTDDSVTVRGISADVRDVLALLKEQLTGICESRIELDAAQLSKVRAACRDPTHMDRMRSESNATIELDLSTSALVMSGKRANVKKAKHLVIRFLDFLLPLDFSYVKISKPLHATVGSAASLADVAAVSGAVVTLDRDISSIAVQSSDAANVEKAVAMLKSMLEEAEKLVYVVQFDASEAWLIPLVIGRGGNQVNELRMDSDCNIDISKEDRTVTVSGEDEDSVKKVRAALDKLIDAARRECAFVKMPSDAISAFVGRGGAHIRLFADQHGVEIERVRKDQATMKITGNELSVKSAVDALNAWIAEFEQSHAAKTIPVEKSYIPAVLGKEGAVVNALQKEFGCKIEIDREAFTVSAKGGSEEKRAQAIQKIQDIIAEAKANVASQRKVAPNDMTERMQPQEPKEPAREAKPTDGRKDRSSEFAARPVGLAVVEKPKKKRNNRGKNKSRDSSPDAQQREVPVSITNKVALCL